MHMKLFQGDQYTCKRSVNALGLRYNSMIVTYFDLDHDDLRLKLIQVYMHTSMLTFSVCQIQIYSIVTTVNLVQRDHTLHFDSS